MEEPELNVEAEIREIVEHEHRYYCKQGLLNRCEECASDVAQSTTTVLALIQQVSDQKVKGFAEKLKEVGAIDGGEDVEPFGVHFVDIDQTLADYLSHKEARDGE